MRECLDSLVNQTLQDIEIIVVNDCSPDSSEAIVLEYMRKDSRIVYIRHEKNRRQGGARNTGIKAARGQYLTFVDSDDYVDVTLYEAALQLFQEYEAQVDIVSMPYLRWRESGEVVSFYRAHQGIYNVDLDTLIQYTFFSPCVKIYRTKDIKENHIYFPENAYWEDIAFWAEYCALMHPRVLNLSDEYGFYRYRYRAGSTTELGEIHYKDIPCMYRALYHNLCRRDLMDKEVFFSFYKIAMQSFSEAALYLQKQYHTEFATNLIDFINEIDFNKAPQRCAPLWFHLYQKKSYHARLRAVRRFLFVLKLKSILKDLYKSMIRLSYLH